MTNRIDFRFRYQARRDSPLGSLLKYLRSEDTEFPPQQMVMSALNAFWYPLACKWSGQCTEDRLQSIARHAIYELQQQIKYLARAFGLEQELVDLGVSAIENYSDHASVQDVEITEPPEPAEEGPDLVKGYEETDELLNQMLK